jgi:hypothetical protein
VHPSTCRKHGRNDMEIKTYPTTQCQQQAASNAVMSCHACITHVMHVLQ